MGATSSRHTAYPLPRTSYQDAALYPPQTNWFLTGKSRKGKERAGTQYWPPMHGYATQAQYAPQGQPQYAPQGYNYQPMSAPMSQYQVPPQPTNYPNFAGPQYGFIPPPPAVIPNANPPIPPVIPQNQPRQQQPQFIPQSQQNPGPMQMPTPQVAPQPSHQQQRATTPFNPAQRSATPGPIRMPEPIVMPPSPGPGPAGPGSGPGPSPTTPIAVDELPPGFIPVPEGANIASNTYTQPNEPPRQPNPLPMPPRDVWDAHSPYRRLMDDLPATTAFLTGEYVPSTNLNDGRPGVTRTNTIAGLFSGSARGKKKGKGRGLFRSHSSSTGPRRPEDVPVGGIYFTAPPPGQGQPPPPIFPMPRPTDNEPLSSTSSQPPPQPGMAPPPIRFNHLTPPTQGYAGFLNHSPHRVMYKNKMYPTALHLHEALKFLEDHDDNRRPGFGTDTGQPAEQIRACVNVQDVYPLSTQLHKMVRQDWGNVFMEKMEEVIYLKFRQHPDLRSLLLGTGVAEIIYAEASDGFWGEGPLGQGLNHLGKILVRVRERLKAEGFGVA